MPLIWSGREEEEELVEGFGGEVELMFLILM